MIAKRTGLKTFGKGINCSNVKFGKVIEIITIDEIKFISSISYNWIIADLCMFWNLSVLTNLFLESIMNGTQLVLISS